MNTAKYVVVTQYGHGIDVYESNSKRMCNAYLKQALAKGSKPGFLKCMKTSEWKKMEDRT